MLHGFRSFGYGHSFGVLSHYYGREAGLELREDIDTVVRPGMVISMEPMVTIPEGRPGAGGYRWARPDCQAICYHDVQGARHHRDQRGRQHGEHHQVPLRTGAQCHTITFLSENKTCMFDSRKWISGLNRKCWVLIFKSSYFTISDPSHSIVWLDFSNTSQGIECFDLYTKIKKKK